MQQELPQHPHYVPVNDLKQSDAVAYAFTKKDGKLTLYPYKYRAFGEDEIRIKIHYTGLCQSDSLHARSKWSSNIVYPCVPGHEILGVIEKIGANVQEFKVGEWAGCNPQRDFCSDCEFCKKGDNNVCPKFEGLYDNYFGGYSTHIQLKAKSAFRVPQNLKVEVAAPLLCAGVTVYAPLKRFGRPNNSCAVVGIGGLGHLAVQYACKMGMTVTAFTTSDRVSEIHSLGASFIASSTDKLQLEKLQRRYDIVVNTLFIDDEELFKAHQRLTAVGGTYVQVGSPPSNVNFKLDFQYLTFNQIMIAGSLIGTHQETEDMLQFSVDHNVYPICETFAFEEFDKAFDKLENGRPKFRCVVNVKNWAEAMGIHK